MPREQYHVDIAYITNAKTPKEVGSKAGTLPDEEEVPDEVITIEDGEAEVKEVTDEVPPDTFDLGLPGRTPRAEDIARVRAASGGASSGSEPPPPLPPPPGPPPKRWKAGAIKPEAPKAKARPKWKAGVLKPEEAPPPRKYDLDARSPPVPQTEAQRAVAEGRFDFAAEEPKPKATPKWKAGVLKPVEEEVEEPKGRPKWKAGVLKPMEEPEPPKPRVKIWKGALKRVDKEEKEKQKKAQKIPEIWCSKANCLICVDVFS